MRNSYLSAELISSSLASSVLSGVGFVFLDSETSTVFFGLLSCEGVTMGVY